MTGEKELRGWPRNETTGPRGWLFNWPARWIVDWSGWRNVNRARWRVIYWTGRGPFYRASWWPLQRARWRAVDGTRRRFVYRPRRWTFNRSYAVLQQHSTQRNLFEGIEETWLRSRIRIVEECLAALKGSDNGSNSICVSAATHTCSPRKLCRLFYSGTIPYNECRMLTASGSLRAQIALGVEIDPRLELGYTQSAFNTPAFSRIPEARFGEAPRGIKPDRILLVHAPGEREP